MKFLFIVCVLLLSIFTGTAQPVNLVPNPSFEDTIDYNNGFLAPKVWDMNLGTPDYFTSLFNPPYDSRKTPASYYGFQIPKDGKSYVGLVVRNKVSIEKREYIQIKLNNSLIKDSVYNVSFWVNLPDSFHWACDIKNIGFAFSDTMVKSNFEVLHRLSPKYFTDSNWDTSNKIEWEEISSSIKSSGRERYLIIGNFLWDSLTPLVNVGGGDKFTFKEQSYYFIDQIKVHLSIRNDKPKVIDEMIVPNVFTPNNDNINDVWKVHASNIHNFQVQIFNRWGAMIKELKSLDEYWDGYNNAAGIYYYRLLFQKDGIDSKKSGTITLVR